MSPSPTRPWQVIGFEELLSELIARARLLRPHLGSRLVSAMLTYGVRYRTLSCEERCGRMIAGRYIRLILFVCALLSSTLYLYVAYSVYARGFSVCARRFKIP